MKVIPVIILLFSLFVFSSCTTTRDILRDYQESQVIANNTSPSQDNTFASIIVEVKDIETNDPIPFCEIEISNDYFQKSVLSSFDGNVLITSIPEGTYDLKVSFVGYRTLIIERIDVLKNEDSWITVGLLSWPPSVHM